MRLDHLDPDESALTFSPAHQHHLPCSNEIDFSFGANYPSVLLYSEPESGQEELFKSHVGGSRSAYNHFLQLVSENWAQIRTEKESGEQGTEYLSTRHFGLVTLWNSHKAQFAPWYAENSTWVYNDADQKLSSAFENFYKKRAGFPSSRI